MYHPNVVHAADMHLDGKWRQGFERAVTHAGNVAGNVVKHAGNKVHEAALHAKNTYREWQHERKTQKPASNNMPTTSTQSMKSNIDLCECSRRVQGHLAILYPDLH